MPATTTETRRSGSGQYVDFDEYVDYHLDKVRGGVKATDVLTALGGIAALVLGYLLVFVVCDHWIVPGGFGATARTSMLLGIVVVAVAWVVWKVVLPARRRVTALYAADMIERAEPELAGNLRNLIDLRRSGRPAPEAIKGTMEKRAALHMTEIDVDTTVDRTRLMHVSYALLAVVVLSCAYVLVSPKKVSTSIWRALAPTSNVGVATRTAILEVDPGDTEVLARSRLDVTVDVSGEEPDRVLLLFTTADRRFVDEPLELRADDEFPKRYVGTLAGENGRGILQSTSYRIEAGDATSPTYEVTVVQPPAATMNEVRITPPAYTKLPEKTRQGGHFDGFEGSTIHWTATTNQKVQRAIVQFSDDETFERPAEEVRMQVSADGRTLTAKLEGWARREARDVPPYPKYYRVQVWNERGDGDPEPTAYRVNMKLDLPPEVLLIDPAEDLQRPANATVPLTIEARDDFGLKTVGLKVRKDNETIRHDPIAEVDGRLYAPNQPFPLDLSKLNLKPGDEIEVTLQVKDNKEPHSQLSPPTTPLRIRIAEPADPAELEQQQRRDDRRREQRLDEHRQRRAEEGEAVEQPAEGGAGEPQPGEPGGGEGDPMGGDPMPGEGDPMDGGGAGEPREGAEPGEGANPDGGTAETERRPGEGGPRPDGPREPGTEPTGGEPGEQPEGSDPLENDGSVDEEATQRLIDNLFDESELDNPPEQPTDPMGGTDPQPGESDPMPGGGGTDPMGGTTDPARDPMGTDPMGGESPGEGANPDGGEGNPMPGEPGEGRSPDAGDPKAGEPGEGAGGEKPTGAGPDENPPMTEETLDSEIDQLEQIDNRSPAQESELQRLMKERRDRDQQKMTKDEVEREIDRLKKQQKGQPGGERKPGDPDSPEELKKEIDELQKRKEELERNPQGGEAGPMGGDPMAGGDSTSGDPMNGGDPMPGEPGGDPMAGGDPKPGDPMGGDPGGQPKPGDPKPGDPKPGDPKGGSPEGGEPGEVGPKPGEPGGGQPKTQDPPNGDGAGDDAETLQKKPDGANAPKTEQEVDAAKRDLENKLRELDRKLAEADKEELDRLQRELDELRKDEDRLQEAAKSVGGEPGESDVDKRIEALQDRIVERLARKLEDMDMPKDDVPGEPMPEANPKDDKPREPMDRRPEGEPGPDGGEAPTNVGDQPPTRDQLEREIERLKKLRDDPRARPMPGDPRSREELEDRIENLQREQDALGEPGGEPRPGEPREGGMPGEGQPTPGEGQPMPGGEPGGKPMPGGGEPNGRPGDPREAGDVARGGDAPTGGGKPREGEGDDPTAAPFEGKAGDEPNVRNARRATELVLNKLEGQLERGEVDPELLDRLGWNENDLRNYVDRMRDRFRTFEETEARPETAARKRQFEEMLRGLDFRSTGGKRRAGTGRKSTPESYGGRDIPAPAELREAYDAYTRSIGDLLKREGEPVSE